MLHNGGNVPKNLDWSEKYPEKAENVRKNGADMFEGA